MHLIRAPSSLGRARSLTGRLTETATTVRAVSYGSQLYYVCMIGNNKFCCWCVARAPFRAPEELREGQGKTLGPMHCQPNPTLTLLPLVPPLVKPTGIDIGGDQRLVSYSISLEIRWPRT